VILAAESWYVSGAFWVGVAGVAAVAVAAWVGWAAVNPRRRLSYGMPVVTRLLNAGTDVRQSLEVRRGGVLLADPHVLEVVLISRGRLGIPSSAFDKDKPLTLDVGAPIIEVLQTTTTAGGAVPGYGIDGSTLTIGPDRIGRRQTITFSLLVDGPRPTLTCPQPPLNDVQIRKSDSTRSDTAAAAVAGAMAAGAPVGAGAMAWELGRRK
jgi:hypothetical protein